MKIPFFPTQSDDEVERGWFIAPGEGEGDGESVAGVDGATDEEAGSGSGRRGWTRWAVALLVGAVLIGVELKTSWIQALTLSTWAGAMTYHVDAGPSDAVRFPEHGPFNERLGYAQIPAMTDSLVASGFRVDAQARISGAMQAAHDLGLHPVYDTKDAAGLHVQDRVGRTVFRAQYPARVYATPDDVPELTWRSLLFIENKELMDDDYVFKNPAIEWDRFAAAVVQRIVTGGEGPGGSTLATQLTKVRNSPGGRTPSSVEKLRQMASASLLAYRDGARTVDMRRDIVKEYLNSLPLAAALGHGEVNGLGDGLWAWYGVDADSVDALLRQGANPSDLQAQARAYRQTLSLLLATRSPSRFFRTADGPDALAALTDRYLPLLAAEGIITEALRDAARATDLTVLDRAPGLPEPPFVARKAANAIRTDLLQRLDVASLPALDRYDLRVRTTFDRDVQRAVVDVLETLHDPTYVREQGLVGARLLASGDPSRVTYSVVLYERDSTANVLRVQADNFPGPFDVNRGSKLELGSTAKLRALVTYLEVIERVYDAHRGRPADSLRAVPVARTDPLTRWTLDRLLENPDLTRAELMDAAMQRTYSGGTGERFFTGGGVHTFSNFSPDTGGTMTVATAMRLSVNLVFIRMMRDVVNYHVARLPGQPGSILDDASDARREAYLRRFADQEGRTFLTRYYRAYANASSGGGVLRAFGEQHRLNARRLGYAYRSVFPEASRRAFDTYIRRYATNGAELSDADLRSLFRQSDVDGFTWQDRGYLAGVHPLELWLVGYLHVRPNASLSTVHAASAEVRQDVYAWLFAKRKGAQDPRIRTILEQEAFVEIHRMWARLGYPFEQLVPTYATALGSSADRPAALAELVGIVLRDGVRYPSIRIDTLQFAAGTPFETTLRREVPAPVRVLSPEVCRVVRAAMIDVVDRGTAVRARGALVGPDGAPLPIGGKTGTGDNRIVTVRSDGSRGGIALNRTSTFVFFAGDRFFGTVVAYVAGQDAENYGFTSSLPAQILQILGPTLSPLVGTAPPATNGDGA